MEMCSAPQIFRFLADVWNCENLFCSWYDQLFIRVSLSVDLILIYICYVFLNPLVILILMLWRCEVIFFESFTRFLLIARNVQHVMKLWFHVVVVMWSRDLQPGAVYQLRSNTVVTQLFTFIKPPEERKVHLDTDNSLMKLKMLIYLIIFHLFFAESSQTYFPKKCPTWNIFLKDVFITVFLDCFHTFSESWVNFI